MPDPTSQARLRDYVRRVVWHIAACAGSPVRTAFQHNEADHSRRRMDDRVGYLDDSRRMSCCKFVAIGDVQFEARAVHVAFDRTN